MLQQCTVYTGMIFYLCTFVLSSQGNDIVLSVMFFKLLTDVAIGAPREGDDGSGAVYIYHGSSRGIETQYRQVY